MRAVVTRVSEASVTADEVVVGVIGAGLLVLVGVGPADRSTDARKLADKVAGLRIFADDHRPMNRSVVDVGGAVLVVSQFTLMADTSRGRRPSLTSAAPPEHAEPLYDEFVAELRDRAVPVETGRFGASMQVASVNDGPVTVLLSTGTEDDK